MLSIPIKITFTIQGWHISSHERCDKKNISSSNQKVILFSEKKENVGKTGTTKKGSTKYEK